MKIFTTLAIAATVLSVGASTAAAEYGSSQPDPVIAPDTVDRYVANRNAAVGSDAVDRYVLNDLRANAAARQTGAAGHPDSRAERPGPAAELLSASVGGRDWGTGIVGALGGALLALLAVVGASAIRGRRRLVLR